MGVVGLEGPRSGLVSLNAVWKGLAGEETRVHDELEGIWEDKAVKEWMQGSRL